jgi:hypothetical protein
MTMKVWGEKTNAQIINHHEWEASSASTAIRSQCAGCASEFVGIVAKHFPSPFRVADAIKAATGRLIEPY